MLIDSPENQAARWRSEAVAADRLAGQARDLAVAIERRRIELQTRLDPAKAAHRPAVWASRAAEVSRTTLVRSVGREIWNARERLLATRVALERRAGELDEEARSQRRRADLIEGGVGGVGDSPPRVS